MGHMTDSTKKDKFSLRTCNKSRSIAAHTVEVWSEDPLRHYLEVRMRAGSLTTAYSALVLTICSVLLVKKVKDTSAFERTTIIPRRGISPIVKPSCCFSDLSSSGLWNKTVDDGKIGTVLRLRGCSPRSISHRCSARQEIDVLSQTWFFHSCDVPSLPKLLENASSLLRDNAVPMLWVGDSLLNQFYDSFTDLTELHDDESRYSRSYLLVDPYSLTVPNSSDILKCAKNHSMCPVGVNEYKTFFEPNVTLPYHRSISALQWGGLLEKGTFKTLLINVGHHWWKETSSTSAGFERGANAFIKYPRMVQGTVQFLRAINFSGRVIYVTSPPGFPGCGKSWKPNEPPRNKTNGYSWFLPQKLEHLWSSTFKRVAPNIPFYVLNITALSLLRGDAHRGADCLHYCQIGVPDEWTRVLLGVLLHEMYLGIHA